ERRGFDLDRTDPLAAVFDEILGAIDDPDIAVGIDGRDVAGVEPAIGVERRTGRPVEIARRDPGSLDPQLTAALAIVRQRLAVGVDDANLDARRGPTGHRAKGDLLVRGQRLL